MKRAAKRISLHRETLRHLSVREMDEAAGGSVIITPPPGFTVSCFATVCPAVCDGPTRAAQNCTGLC